ncbi:hypothetical protein E2C01_018030 [Portunus trituberculatus]|uniref:Uncharacterized protein n=1 Tax=Portunus trituberculatus TaxID=210409 RepID=A0A5B7DVE2_PORTR|nr:hypothetical protein [Portunus trituberculatus]
MKGSDHNMPCLRLTTHSSHRTWRGAAGSTGLPAGCLGGQSASEIFVKEDAAVRNHWGRHVSQVPKVWWRVHFTPRPLHAEERRFLSLPLTPVTLYQENYTGGQGFITSSFMGSEISTRVKQQNSNLKVLKRRM